jgi:NADH-quinone oxidoreductase subunit M
MTAPMLILAGVAFLTGLMPGLALDLVDRAQAAMGLALMPHHLGGVSTPGGNLDMLWINGALIGAIGVGALVFLLGNRRHVTHQYDNYAGGHFLSSDLRFHYSHNFYPGVMRVIGPLYRGSVRWLEEALASATDVMAEGSAGLYRAAPAQLYLLAATVVLLWWALGG